MNPVGGENSGRAVEDQAEIIVRLARRLSQLELAASNGAPAALLGEVRDYAGTTVPAQWLACSGQAVSRTTYATLFTAIGTTYGAGDTTTTFNVPNLIGRVTVGQGGSFPTLGAVGGATDAIVVSHSHSEGAHSHTVSGTVSVSGTVASASHSHTATVSSHTHSYTHDTGTAGVASGTAVNARIGAGGNTSGATTPTASVAGGDHAHTFSGSGSMSASAGSSTPTINSTGSAGTNANLPPYMVTKKIIFAGV